MIVRLAQRLESLEVSVPKPRQRTVLVWLDEEVLVWLDEQERETGSADSDPELPDPNLRDGQVVLFTSREGAVESEC